MARRNLSNVSPLGVFPAESGADVEGVHVPALAEQMAQQDRAIQAAAEQQADRCFEGIQQPSAAPRRDGNIETTAGTVSGMAWPLGRRFHAGGQRKVAKSQSRKGKEKRRKFGLPHAR